MVDDYRGTTDQGSVTATQAPPKHASPQQAPPQTETPQVVGDQPDQATPRVPRQLGPAPRTASHEKRRLARFLTWSRPRQIAAEAFVSLAVAGGFLVASQSINVNPMVRVGQVSGLAQLQFGFAIAAILLVVAVLVGERLLPERHRRWLEPLACAAAAGLFGGLVGGGIAVALHRTPYGLLAGYGDYIWIGQWANSVLAGHGLPAHHYPPLSIWGLAGWARLTGQPVQYAMKDMQLVGTALFGPAAYLAWRLLMRPAVALGVGVVAMIPFVEPVKAYPQLTLVMLIPVLILFAKNLRDIATRSLRSCLLIGVGFGVGLGALFMLYSGWFVWCAPGFLAACAVVVPKRGSWRKVLGLAAASVATFVATTWIHLTGLLASTGGVSDAFFYFDTDSDPAYFAMWRNDRAGDITVWPPPGELGYVGLFTLLLVLGVGVALWLGWRRTTVISVGLMAVGAWMMRMYLAGESYATHTVRLYPRTTMVLLYCTLILTGLAVIFAARAVTRAISRPVAWPARPPLGILLIPLLMVFAFTGSATIDHFMPGPRGTSGDFATDAHIHPLLNGECPHYGIDHGCPAPPRG